MHPKKNRLNFKQNAALPILRTFCKIFEIKEQFIIEKILYINMGASMGLKASLNYLTKPIFKKFKYVTPQVELRSVANPMLFIGDIAQFSQKAYKKINGKAINISSIQTEEEFKIILEELMQGSSYKWKSVKNAFDYEKAILPYAGRGDISLDINTFLREGILKNKTYIDITEENIKKYIQALEYGLRHLDKEYGSYSGIVYRYGDFLSKTPNYVSTSDKILGALKFANESNPCEKTYNIIFTKHGHMINEMQKRLGFKFAESESEILLDPGKSYIGLIDDTPQLSSLREQFYQEFNKAYPNCNSKDVKLNFWQEI